jgi:hypothetical protein
MDGLEAFIRELRDTSIEESKADRPCHQRRRQGAFVKPGARTIAKVIGLSEARRKRESVDCPLVD